MNAIITIYYNNGLYNKPRYQARCCLKLQKDCFLLLFILITELVVIRSLYVKDSKP